MCKYSEEREVSVHLLISYRWFERSDSQSLGLADSLLYGEIQEDEGRFSSAGNQALGDSNIWKDSLGTSRLSPRKLSMFQDSEPTGYTVQNVGGHVGAVQFWQHALAAGYGDGAIRLFDLRSGQCNRIFDGYHGNFGGLGHTQAITCLKFDEQTIVTGSRDKTVKIWDLRNGMVLDTIPFNSHVSSVSFDCSDIVVAAGDNEVHLVNRHSGSRSSLGLSADGSGWIGHVKSVRAVAIYEWKIVSAGKDGAVKIWRKR